MARDALDAQLESEHGILEIKSRADVVRAGGGSGVAYALGAAIPLLITLTAPVTAEAWTILVAVLMSLTVTLIVGRAHGAHESAAHAHADARRRHLDDGCQLRHRQAALLTAIRRGFPSVGCTRSLGATSR